VAEGDSIHQLQQLLHYKHERPKKVWNNNCSIHLISALNQRISDQTESTTKTKHYYLYHSLTPVILINVTIIRIS